MSIFMSYISPCSQTHLSLFKQNMNILVTGANGQLGNEMRIVSKNTTDYYYKEALNYLQDPILAEDRVIPVVFPNWDYTPRRGASDLIFHDATPELFKKHVIQALYYIKDKPVDKQIAFVKSWNEWGEGNYMEPDMEFGKGRIKALKDAIYEVKQEVEKE